MVDIANLRIKVDSGQLGRAEQKLGSFQKTSKKTSDSVNVLTRRFIALTGAFFTFQTARNIIRTADSFNLLEERIKDITRETGNFSEVFKELTRISSETGSSLEVNIGVFQRLVDTISEAGRSQKDAFRFLEAIQQISVVGGVGNEELRFGLRQLGQSLGEQVVRAQEFNSILENVFPLAQAISEGLGKSVPELRQMVLEGELLSRDVLDAILSQADDIKERFDDMSPTIQRSSNALKNEFLIALNNINDEFRVTERLARGIAQLTEFIGRRNRANASSLALPESKADEEFFSKITRPSDISIAFGNERFNPSLLTEGREGINELLSKDKGFVGESLIKSAKEAAEEQKSLNEEYREASAILEDMSREYDRVGAVANSVSSTIASGFERAIFKADSFKDSLASVAQTLASIIFQETAGSAISSAIGSFASGFFSGTTPNPTIAGAPRKPSFRASGGMVNSGSPYIVGERGPELFVPTSSGNVLPNSKSGSQVVYNIDARGADVGVEQRIMTALQKVNSSIETRALTAVQSANRRNPQYLGA